MTNKLTSWEVCWINGFASAKGTTLRKAVKNMKLENRKIHVGMLVQVRNKGITSFWSGDEFIKCAKLKPIPITKRGSGNQA